MNKILGLNFFYCLSLLIFLFSMVKFKLLQAADSRPGPDQLKECARMAAENAQLIGNKIALIFILALFLLVQACLSVAGYSGFQKPPMFGDFEAQRHWMEVTINLPPREWYVNSSANDLNYWGLDYPPLTAYHSWLLGQIARWLNPDWVHLHASRGLQHPHLKLFMRLSVIASMMAIYAPALVQLLFRNILAKYGKGAGNKDKSEKALRLLGASLLYPGLLFVDCAHFQYNHCSLALFLWALSSLDSAQLGLGSLLFVLALNHKQMELYHAMPVAVFLLARSIHRDPFSVFNTLRISITNLLLLSAIVLGTFLAIWAPFLWPDLGLALQVLRRIFPFSRGLFEDKVANFWCCASVLVKFKNIYSPELLIKVSTLLVLLSSLPSLLCLFYRPNSANLRLALCSCSLSFFLFSFQVHEKSILLVAIPALLLLPDEKLQGPVAMFLSTSAFSLYPLALKDGVGEVLPLFLAYPFVLRLLVVDTENMAQNQPSLVLFSLLYWPSTACSLSVCLLQLLVSPPPRLPHLFPLLNALLSFAVFSAFWLWLNVQIVAWNWRAFRMEKGKSKKKKL